MTSIERREYTYEYDETRSSEARLAIFIDTPCDPDPAGNVQPEFEGPAQREVDFQCFLYDLCKTGRVPKQHDWNTPGRNTISLVSLSDENLNVKFKGSDGPDIVTVKKLDHRPLGRSKFIDGLEEINGLVIVQDIGYEAPLNFEQQLTTICGLVMDAKGLSRAGRELVIEDFPVPVALFPYAAEGRPRKSSKMGLEAIIRNTPWIYKFVRGIEHEADIASGIIQLVSQIEKRGISGYRLWPGVIKAVRPKKVDNIFTPPPNTDQEVISPALSSTLVTPHLALTEGEGVVPTVQTASPIMEGSNTEDTTPEKIKRTRLGTPIPIPSTPGMIASGSGRSLSSSASNRSLRRQASPVMPIEEETPETPEAGPSARPDVSPIITTPPNVVPKDKYPVRPNRQPVIATVIPPTPPPFSDIIARGDVRPVPSSLPSFEYPPRRAPPPPVDPLDQDVLTEPYIPRITTAGEGDSILNRLPHRDPPGQSGTSVRSQSGEVRTFIATSAPGEPQRINWDEPPKELPEPPTNTGFDLFGIFKGKSTSKKGKGTDRNADPGQTTTASNSSSTPSFSTDPVVRVPPKLNRMGVGEPGTPGAMVQMRQSPERPRAQPASRRQVQEQRSGWLEDDDVTGGNTGGLCGTGCNVS